MNDWNDVFVVKVNFFDKGNAANYVQNMIDDLSVYGIELDMHSEEYLVIVKGDKWHIATFRAVIRREEDGFELKDDNVMYIDVTNRNLQPFFDALSLWLI